MAYARTFKSGDGSTTDFVFGFPYIDQSHVKVYVDGVLNDNWSFFDANTIRFNVAPASGAVILITRSTSPNQRLVDYSVPSSLNEEDLDNDSLQAFYLAQEASDTANAAMSQDTASAQFDAQNLQIKNVADPTDPNDATNKAYVDGVTAPAIAAADTAEAAAALAQASVESLEDFGRFYQGALASAPSTRTDGSGLQVGDFYYDTTTEGLYVYDGSAWLTAPVGPQGPQGPQGVPGEGVPAGGTQGQIMVKQSGSDYDIAWEDNSGGGFEYVDASGTTTPTLDLDAGNYFDLGVTVGDTTVSLANATGQRRWSLTFEGDTLNVFSLTNVIEETPTFDVGSQETSPEGITFKPDGTRMYVCGQNGGRVQQYDLSTPWDVSTAVFSGNSGSYNSTYMQDVRFSDDGLWVFTWNDNSERIQTGQLSTAWDVTTAGSSTQEFISTGLSSESGFLFNSDGTQFAIYGYDNSPPGYYLRVYNLSTAWDVDTRDAGTVHRVDNGISSIGSQRSFTLSSDGSKVKSVKTSTASDILEATLSTPNDLTTLLYQQEVDLSSVLVKPPRSICFGNGDTKLFTIDRNTDTVRTYRSASSSSVTLPAGLVNSPVETIIPGQRHFYEFVTFDGGSNIFLTKEKVI